MAFDGYSNNLAKGRGLDPRALSMLESKKQAQDKRKNELKRKQTEREISALRARLHVVDREIQRISVSERRYKGEETRAEQEFKNEARNVAELTKELARHSDKVRELQNALNSKKSLLSRGSTRTDFGAETAQRETERLQDELKTIDREIEQLNLKRRRVISDMTRSQQKLKQSQDKQSKTEFQAKQVEFEIAKILQNLRSEETVLNQFKTRFSIDQKNLLRKQKQYEDIKSRETGTAKSSPALQNEKQKIEQKIKELERTLK